MKRFWREVGTGTGEGGHRVLLDGRPVRTPARNLLAVPEQGLAVAIAAEWEAQQDEVRPASMPLTRLASTALDRLPDRRADAIEEVLGYARTDLLCYRAAQPVELVARQTRTWQPLVDWLAATHGARLAVTTGLLPIEQPDPALARLAAVVGSLDDWHLVGLHAGVTALGSIVLGLALHAGRIDADEALAAGLLDERFSIERWGEEIEQQRRHAALRADVEAVAGFLDHLTGRART